MAPHAPIRPSIALAAFAEKFIEGRRVLVFGNALSPFWEQLIERGARLVHVCDSDASRVAEAAARNTSQNVSFAPLGGAGLAVRDGAFDVGFIDNLATFADPAQTAHKLKRALSPRGVAIVAAPNPDMEQPLVGGAVDAGQKLDYYTLYDLVHREFPVVRMVGQMPFVGYSVAELAPAEDPEPCLDAGFVPGGTEEPEWFVAVASHVDLEFEPFLVVQLAHETLLKSGTERLLREQLRAARGAERSAVERLARLEVEQRRVAEVAERHQKDVDLARQIRLLQEELERKESWIMQLEARAATADARADEADQELDELRTQLGLNHEIGEVLPTPNLPNLADLETERKSLHSQLSLAQAEHATLKNLLSEAEVLAAKNKNQILQLEARTKVLESERDEHKAQILKLVTERNQADLERDEAARKVTELQSTLNEPAPELVSELTRLETQLSERGEQVRRLEGELRKTERIGTLLLRELERAKSQLRQAVVIEPTATAPTEAVATVTTEDWTSGPTVAAAATTEQGPEVSSTWSDGATSAATDLETLRSKLDRLAALAARQQADLGANQWQLEQFQAENEELRGELATRDSQLAELATMRSRLQETEVLLAQLRWRQATASDDGPVR